MNDQIFGVIMGFVISLIWLFGNKKFSEKFRKKSKYFPKMPLDEKTIRSDEKIFFIVGLFLFFLSLFGLFRILCCQ